MKRSRGVGISQETVPVLEWKRYFFLVKLRRLLAYVMRFAKNTQVKKEVPQTGPITSTEQKEGIWRKVSSACCRTKPATISMVIGQDCVYSSQTRWNGPSSHTKIQLYWKKQKKVGLNQREALCSVTEGWILASKLNCSRFVLPYPTTFIIQPAKPFCGYVYCIRFSRYYMQWTDQDGRSKPLVKQRGR